LHKCATHGGAMPFKSASGSSLATMRPRSRPMGSIWASSPPKGVRRRVGHARWSCRVGLLCLKAACPASRQARSHVFGSTILVYKAKMVSTRKKQAFKGSRRPAAWGSAGRWEGSKASKMGFIPKIERFGGSRVMAACAVGGATWAQACRSQRRQTFAKDLHEPGKWISTPKDHPSISMGFDPQDASQALGVTGRPPATIYIG